MTHEVVRRLRRGVTGVADPEPSDEQLLADYSAGADPTALDALVRRHAPMVWGVCRRVAGPGPDAEDAFQAAFLVLVRRVTAIDRPHLLGNWLYGVASRTARKARAAAGRRRSRETDLTQTDTPTPAPGPWDDVLPLLDEELARLPERYRAALVLCDLQGKTRREAAELTGAPAGTIAARVARGRALLATRLVRRGVGVPAAVVAALLTRDAWARVPTRLLNAAVRAPGGSVPSRAAALSDRVVNAMLLTRLAAVTGRLFGLAAGLALAVLVTASVAGQPPAVPSQPPAQPTEQPRPAAPAPGWREAFVLTHDHPVTALACSATQLAVGDTGGNLLLCDPLTGKNRVRKLKGAPPGTPNALRDYDQLAFTAGGKKLFMIRQEQSSVWFTLTDNGDEKAWGIGGGPTRFLGFSAGAVLWLEGYGKTLVVRPNVYLTEPPADGPDYRASARHDTDVLLAALAPDGERYAVATAGGRIHMPILKGEVEEGTRPGNTIALDNQKVTALRFSPDGAKLAAVGDGGFARVYEAKTGKELVSLKGHSGIVFCAAFSPDGATLVTGGDDNVARIWDATTGRLRAELKGHTDAVRAAEFAPSGRLLYTASPDKTVRAWAPPR